MQRFIYERMKEVTSFSSQNESYSPMFSSIGLGAEPGESGVGKMWLHYNRATRTLFNKLVSFPFEFNPKLSAIYRLVYGDDKARLSFWKNDGFLLEIETGESVRLFPEVSGDTASLWVSKCDGEYLFLRGYSKNKDSRDPDERVPFVIGVRAVTGKVSADGEMIAKPFGGKILLAFNIEILKASESSVRHALSICPETTLEAAVLCRRWLRNYSRDFAVELDDDRVARLTAKAVNGLLFNATRAQGKLEGNISPFPSRGGYPATFLWDTYFQNFGYSLLGSDLHREFLRQIAKGMRFDGKLPQFMCSTWDRPHDTQPALLGWAVKNAMGDSFDLAWEMLPILEANNEWWLSSRMTDKGLVYCPSGLETGQDDSPRFDGGATLACDMNSYLLDQLHVTAELESMLGLEDKAKKWTEKANALAENMMKYLYCKKDSIFYDVSLETGEFIKVVTPASFLPLWAGIELEKKQKDKLLRKYLLNKKCMMGDVPFPSVAYNDPRYEHDKWWRGPTWISAAWLMLETLDRLGLYKERQDAADKLWKMIVKDGKMHELFDSQTGEGLGNEQQGWTCGIFLRLLAERQK